MRFSPHLVLLALLGPSMAAMPSTANGDLTSLYNQASSAASDALKFGACVTDSAQADFAAADQLVGDCTQDPLICQALADQSKAAKQAAIQKAWSKCSSSSANPMQKASIEPGSQRNSDVLAVPLTQPPSQVPATPPAPAKQTAQTPQAPPAATDPQAPAPTPTAAAAPQPAPAPASTSSANLPSNANDTSAAQAQATADIRSCTNAQASASRCCANPASCGSTNNTAQPTAANGMQTCQQMNGLGQGSTSLNNQYASICAGSQGTCQYTCNQLINTYSDYVDNCANCASASIYQNTLSTLQAQNDVCNQLSAQINTLGSQATNGALAAGGGLNCQNLSNLGEGMTPQSSASTAPSSFNPNDPYGCVANPSSQACQSCAQNPNSVACRALSVQKNVGQASLATNTRDPSTSKGGFNLPDLADSMGPAASLTPTPPTNAARTPTIPNNGGGSGFPGADGKTGPRVDGPSVGRRVLAGNDPTNIMQGERSGGGYSQPYQNNSAASGGGRNYPYGRGAAANSKMAMDLKQYLPGAAQDPNRGLAGLGHFGAEINGRGEDLFKRISNKMVEKCKLGLLLECFP